MPEASQTEELIRLFTADYYEKLYYFCLKKVSGNVEAEDLTAEIAMSIISELRRGTKLVEYGYLEKTDDGYKPTFYVGFKSKIGDLTAEQTAEHDRLYREACEIVKKHLEYRRQIINSEIPQFLKDEPQQLRQAYFNHSDLRGTVLMGALENGYISYGENDERKMLGAYMII